MTIEEQINLVVKTLLEGTENGSVDWYPRSSCFNSETSHAYESLSIDKNTKFQVEITIDSTFSKVDRSNSLWIYNSGLVDGRKYVSSNSDTKKIEQIIFEKYIKPNMKSKAESLVLDSILLNIGNKQTNRDRKLDILLDTDTDKDTEEEKKNKKGFWKW